MNTVFAPRSLWSRELPLISLLLVALVLRAGVLWNLGDNLAADPDNYRRIAESLAAGDGFLDPHSQSPTAYRPPLYPLLIATVLACGGSSAAVGLIQLVLGVATVALTALCGRGLGLDRASLAAGFLVAVDPLLLYQTAFVMTETLATFLAVLMLWLCLGRPSAGRDFSVGITFGLCCLCRPTFWAFGALATAVSIVTSLFRKRPQPVSLAGRGRAALCLAAGVILVIAPWGVRNAIVMGRPIMTTTHGGYTLLLAHNPSYTRAVVEQPWGAVWEGKPMSDWGASLDNQLSRESPPLDIGHLSTSVEIARDKWMSHAAWKYIRDEPLVALKSGLTLVGRMWNIAPLATSGRPLALLLRVAIGAFYSAILVAMLIGSIRIALAEWRTWWPLLVLITSFSAVHFLYWADMRMRTPLVPAIALLAASCAARRRAGAPIPPALA